MKTLITSPNFDYLWKAIEQEIDIKKIDARIARFPDGTPKIQIFKEDVKNTVATVLLDFSDCSEFLNNYMTLHWLIDKWVESLDIIMPYFPVWTMERVGKPWEVATAHAFANLMASLPTWKSGRKNNLHIFDIHAEVEEFMFGANNRINLETHSAFSLLKEKMKDKTIVFPDEWAAKRFSQEFNGNDKVICSKKRVDDKRIIEVKEWSPNWKDIIIIDDLIESWSTISETSKLMKDLWAKSVTSFASHGVFPNNSHIELAKNLDTLKVSDSIPDNIARSQQVDNMEIISIKELVKKIILES